MAYVRKTADEYEVQGWYGNGWEMLTTEGTWKDARAQAACYRENEPATPVRIRKVRTAIEPTTNGV
jgi:hypothetical protein